MNQIEILPHQVSLVVIDILLASLILSVSANFRGAPLVPAPASLLKAAHELRGFRSGQLSQSTAASHAAGCALGRILNLMAHFHVHEVIHAKS